MHKHYDVTSGRPRVCVPLRGGPTAALFLCLAGTRKIRQKTVLHRPSVDCSMP